jgi:hypothetical protein
MPFKVTARVVARRPPRAARPSRPAITSRHVPGSGTTLAMLRGPLWWRRSTASPSPSTELSTWRASSEARRERRGSTWRGTERQVVRCERGAPERIALGRAGDRARWPRGHSMGRVRSGREQRARLGRDRGPGSRILRPVDRRERARPGSHRVQRLERDDVRERLRGRGRAHWRRDDRRRPLRAPGRSLRLRAARPQRTQPVGRLQRDGRRPLESPRVLDLALATLRRRRRAAGGWNSPDAPRSMGRSATRVGLTGGTSRGGARRRVTACVAGPAARPHRLPPAPASPVPARR